MRLGNRATGSPSCGCGGERHTCDNRRVVSIVRDNDDVIIAFDDCTFIRASYDVVNDNMKSTIAGVPPEMAEKLTALDNFKTSLLEALYEVERLDGKTSFVAFKPGFGGVGDAPQSNPLG